MKLNQKGFTLIEMMIVLLVISILLVIAIPNVTKHNSVINSKGCEAYHKTVQAQAQAYQLEKNAIPSISDLENEGYIDSIKCPDGHILEIDQVGNVIEHVETTNEG